LLLSRFLWEVLFSRSPVLLHSQSHTSLRQQFQVGGIFHTARYCRFTSSLSRNSFIKPS
jgi:hypothetical protein